MFKYTGYFLIVLDGNKLPVFFHPLLPVFRKQREDEFFVKPLPFFCNRQVALMATPEIIIRLVCNACLHRIAVYISDKLQKIAVTANKNWFVSATKELPITGMPSVKSLGVYAIYVPHAPCNICIRCLYKNMIVGCHETVGSNTNIPHLRAFFKKLDKHLVVMSVTEYFFSSSTPVHHMVPSARILYSEWTCHVIIRNILRCKSQEQTWP